MRWTHWRVVGAAVAVQAAWILAVVVAALYVPALTATPGVEGQVGTGPALRTKLLASTGVVGGIVVGVLLGRFPVGYRWDRVGYSAGDAGYYAAVAAVVGTTGTFAALAALQVARTWLETGVLAPLVIGVVSLLRLGGFVFLSFVVGFVTGAACFLCGGVVDAVRRTG